MSILQKGKLRRTEARQGKAMEEPGVQHSSPGARFYAVTVRLAQASA